MVENFADADGRASAIDGRIRQTAKVAKRKLSKGFFMDSVPQQEVIE